MPGILLNPSGCCCRQSLLCSPCNIPKSDLTLYVPNPFIQEQVPDFQTTFQLVYTPPGMWSTGTSCKNQLIYTMACLGGVIRFAVTYFVSGACPTGQSQTCSSPGSAPFGLTLVDYTCDPFHFHYRIVEPGCPLMSNIGYVHFYIDE